MTNSDKTVMPEVVYWRTLTFDNELNDPPTFPICLLDESWTNLCDFLIFILPKLGLVSTIYVYILSMFACFSIMLTNVVE